MTSARDQGSELGTLAPLLRKIAATPGPTSVLAPHSTVNGRYIVQRSLGRGGMGVVYEVHDRELDEHVALKLLHHELGRDTAYRQRLRTEVRLARRISHPNVCRVHDLGLDGDQLYVTMELVQGPTLRQILRERHAPTVSTIVDLVVQIASALAAAHRVGVLHRDVKPDNVIIDDGRAVLTDFGVATLAHDNEEVVAGTPSYIAPEVLRGEPFDHRVDVYSTAVLAYELVAGVQPFAVQTLEEAARLAAVPQRPPPLPVTVGPPALREALDRVFATALDPDPASRIASMALLSEAIAHAARADGPHVIAPREASSDVGASTAPRTRRADVRVATALVYRADSLAVGAAEQLERLVVDAGGTPVSVGALEITALFGVPTALGDDAERAVRAAQALLAHAEGRAGLDTVRILLRPHAGTLTAREAFSSASALAEAAEPGQILASSLTARQLAARFEMAGVELGHTTARRIVGPRPSRARAEAATFRSRELAALVAMAEDSFGNRRPRHAEIRARAGYGKTRLREALIARMRERRDVEWLVARADLHGNADPLGMLRAAHEEWHAHATRDGMADRAATFAAARSWLETRSERNPIGVVFEDIQWADELSRELVDQLVTSLDNVPVLILTFARVAEDGAAMPQRPGVDVLSLPPLDPATAGALVQAIAPGTPREAVDEIVARGDGHPFFLEELARDLAERGMRASEHTPLPATIEAVIQVRLDGLAPRYRELITAAAVMGTTFWRDALGHVAESAAATLDDDLVDLEHRGLIAPAVAEGGAGGDRYRFLHTMVREVAYARLDSHERRAAHAAVARWLRQRYPGLNDLDRAGQVSVATDIVAAFAHHLEEAGDLAAAAAAYRIAGLRHLAAAMYRDASRALRRTASLVPAIDNHLATALGDAVLLADSVVEAESWYERALNSTDPQDLAHRALLWHKLGDAATRRADHPRALHCFESGLALAAPDGVNLAPWALRDPRTAALLFGDLGWVAGYRLGDNLRGLPACERAVDLLEGTPYRRELAHALSRLGATYMRASRFRDQLACNQRNLAIGLELADLMMQLTARVNLGVVHGVLGEIDTAIVHTEVARGLARHTGARYVVGLAESNLAGLYLECDRLADAQRCLDEAIVISECAGRRTGLPETYGYA
ncbi:MAG: protein kinase, partial [Kofleriaceae bacterium]|nr:protein kinase [Kofleriaceae bacterium]